MSPEASLLKDPSIFTCVIRKGSKKRLGRCRCVGCPYGIGEEAIYESAGRMGERSPRESIIFELSVVESKNIADG